MYACQAERGGLMPEARGWQPEGTRPGFSLGSVYDSRPRGRAQPIRLKWPRRELLAQPQA